MNNQIFKESESNGVYTAIIMGDTDNGYSIQDKVELDLSWAIDDINERLLKSGISITTDIIQNELKNIKANLITDLYDRFGKRLAYVKSLPII